MRFNDIHFVLIYETVKQEKIKILEWLKIMDQIDGGLL
jgi:hypothetical protein